MYIYNKIMTDYIFEILSDFNFEVKDFLKNRSKDQIPKLQLLSDVIDYDNYSASFTFYRKGDPTNLLEVIKIHNYMDDERTTYLLFYNLKRILEVDNDWEEQVSTFFDSNILPNYYGFQPKNFLTLNELKQGLTRDLSEEQIYNLLELWFMIEYNLENVKNSITEFKEIKGSCFSKDRQVKTLFDLCFYQLSTQELQQVRTSYMI